MTAIPPPTDRFAAASVEIRAVLLALLLAAAVFGIYAQVAGHGFIVCDDDTYIYENAHVREGLTLRGAAWAFTTAETYHWHPVTWLSHMADVSFFGMAPGAHHLVNVFLHALNAILLFLLLGRMTGTLWRPFFAAALFAVHPLHVESVAWAAERKDVLCAFFFLLSLLSYERYARRGGSSRYLAAVALFALSLLSKPMTVTMPAVLLILDYWPLERSVPLRRLLVEKAPFLLLAAAAGVAAVLTQRAGGSVVPLEGIPLPWRVANAVVSCVAYLGQAAWPAGLAVYYPHPGNALPPWQAAGAALLLSLATALSVRERARRPWITAGWLWYLCTLLPVIGLLQVGGQARADRYTYLPLVGIFVAVTWGLAGLASGRRPGRLLPWAGGLAVAALGAAAWHQTGYWKDSVTLFSRSVAVTGSNRFASYNLGFALEKSGRLEEAVGNYLEVLRLAPGDEETLYKMGAIRGRTGRFEEAAGYFREAVRVRPGDSRAWSGLGLTHSAAGRPADAVEDYRKALETDPRNAVAWNNLGVAYERLGRRVDALAAYREAVRISPGYATAQGNLDRVSRDIR